MKTDEGKAGTGGMGGFGEVEVDLGWMEQEAAEGPKQESTEIQKAYLKWGPVQEAMLQAEIEDGEWGGDSLKELAKRLWSTMDEIEEIREQTDPTEWAGKRMARLLEIESLKGRGYNWDRMEAVAVNKLVELVVSRKVTDVNQLAMIAKVANQATRRDADGKVKKNQNGDGTEVNIQINQNNVGAPNLPGPGNLGTINLSLSPRSIQQLSTNRNLIDGEATRLSDQIEMLTTTDMPELSKQADENHG